MASVLLADVLASKSAFMATVRQARSSEFGGDLPYVLAAPTKSASLLADAVNKANARRTQSAPLQFARGYLSEFSLRHRAPVPQCPSPPVPIHRVKPIRFIRKPSNPSIPLLQR